MSRQSLPEAAISVDLIDSATVKPEAAEMSAVAVRVGVVGFLIVAALTACSVSPDPTSTSAPIVAPTGSASPSSAASTARVAVSIADYATQIDFQGAGVDFDSVDRNIHCGIWDAYDYYAPGTTTPVKEPYAGCRPADETYQTDPSADPTGNVGCRGGEMNGDRSPEPVCNSGQVFVGEAPMNGPVGVLTPEQSIAFAGFTCVAPDDGTIECSRDADAAGFTIGRDAYRYF